MADLLDMVDMPDGGDGAYEELDVADGRTVGVMDGELGRDVWLWVAQTGWLEKTGPVVYEGASLTPDEAVALARNLLAAAKLVKAGLGGGPDAPSTRRGRRNPTRRSGGATRS